MTGLFRGLGRALRETWLHRTGRGARAEQEADAAARDNADLETRRAMERVPFLRYRAEVHAWKNAFEDALRRREQETPYRGTSPEAEADLPALPFSPSQSLFAWDRIWDNVVIMKLHDEARTWREERLARSVENRDRG